MNERVGNALAFAGIVALFVLGCVALGLLMVGVGALYNHSPAEGLVVGFLVLLALAFCLGLAIDWED